MDLGLTDKVILVAAASKGLGYGIARACAQDGARVALGSRTEADIKAAAAGLTAETGSDVWGSILDMRSGPSISAWCSAAVARYGQVDGLVVNAGGPPAGKFDDFDDAAWQNAYELTLLSAIRLIRAVLPVMRSAGGGSILTITSSSVKEPIDFLLLSNVMRSGVTSLVKSLSHQLATEKIRVNNLIPGRIDTDRVRSLDETNAARGAITLSAQRARVEADIPWGRYGTTEEFGKAGAFLLSDAAGYITGATLIVDGGAMRTVW